MNKPESELFLAGVETKSMIHWVYGDNPSKPGWTPYPAMAERWERKGDAELAAKNAVESFELKDSNAKPVVKKESEINFG